MEKGVSAIFAIEKQKSENQKKLQRRIYGIDKKRISHLQSMDNGKVC